MSIIRTEAYYRSSNGKNMSRALIWRDTDLEPVLYFQISHDLCDHIGRYDNFAKFLAGKGCVVAGNDHIGHGKTAGDLSELGDFGSPDADIRMIDDMHILHNIMVKRYPNIPCFLFGFGMGSLLSRIYASRFGNELSGLILSGSSYVSPKLSNLEDYSLPVADLLGGDKLFKGLDAFKSITSKYYFKEDDENAYLSQSEDNRLKSEDDMYFDFPITNDSAGILIKILIKSSSYDVLGNIPSDLPILLNSGAKDPIGLFGKSVISLCDKLEELNKNVETRLYPGLRHEILNEDDNIYVFEDILSWIFKSMGN